MKPLFLRVWPLSFNGKPSYCHITLSWQGLNYELRRPLSGQMLKYLLSTFTSTVYLPWRWVEFLSCLQPKIWGGFTPTFLGCPLCNCCFQGFPILISNHPDSPNSIVWLFGSVRLRRLAWVLPALLHGQGHALGMKLCEHGSLPSRVASPIVFIAERNETIASCVSRSSWAFFTGFVPWVSPRLPRLHLVFFGSLLIHLSHPNAM